MIDSEKGTFHYTVDMFSLGVILYELTQGGYSPFYRENHPIETDEIPEEKIMYQFTQSEVFQNLKSSSQLMVEAIQAGSINIYNKVNVNIAYLIHNLLSVDPKDRFTPTRVLMFINEALSDTFWYEFTGDLLLNEPFPTHHATEFIKKYQTIQKIDDLTNERFDEIQYISFTEDLKNIYDSSVHQEDVNTKNILFSFDDSQNVGELLKKEMIGGFNNLFGKLRKLGDSEKLIRI